MRRPSPNGLAARAAAALLALAAAMALALAAAPAAAAGDWSRQMSRDLMSPYCPGRTLADCPSPQAAELRAWIQAQEESGRSRQEVEDQLYRLYGDQILSAPKARGWGLAAYAVPALAMAVGAALLGAVLRRRRGPAPPGEAAAPVPVDPELERRVDEELRSQSP